MRASRILRSAFFAVILFSGFAVREFAAAPPKADFNHDIRPILSEHCFACHGPDEKARKSGLRLDVRQPVFSPAKSGEIPVVPGNLAKSELIRRITTHDEDDLMPPAKKGGKPLSAKQIELLKQWVAEGAEWQQHWAYVKPEHPAPPEVKNRAWPRNDIDRFILSRLEQEGLEPSPEAPKEKLIRRATLDLTGLPPSVDEIDAFLADKSPGAYEKLVDRLLDSKAYGERQAMFWLDLARYGETQGYHHDAHRDMWHWRDWVIHALNQNLPFDTFTTEQLAGDLLPKPTRDQLIATGFHRNEMTTSEGGALPEEYMVKYVVGRVDTTARVWMGTSLACAECHDHKYDPITQKEYYQFFAFFNTVPENGLDAQPNPVPRLELKTAEQEKRLAQFDAEIAALDLAHRKITEEDNAAYHEQQTAWERQQRERNIENWGPLLPVELTAQSGASLVARADNAIAVSGPVPDRDTYTIRLRTPAKELTALRLEALPDPSSPHSKAGRSENGEFILTKIEVSARSLAPGTNAFQKVAVSAAVADTSRGGYPVSGALDDLIETGWSVDVGNESAKQPHFAWFRFGKPVRFAEGAELEVRLIFDAPVPQKTLGRFRLAMTASDGLGDFFSLPDNIRAVLLIDAKGRTPAQNLELQRYYRDQFVPEAKNLAKVLNDTRGERQKFEGTIPVAMIMQEMDKPRETHLLVRGEYNNPGEKVISGVPEAILPWPDNLPRNRLGLAKWLLNPNHPLTGRVTVNHFWQEHFGAGLVKTSEDFGAQGERPSHPQLLDWLATEFVRSGWNMKKLHRLIVTSATYRQDSVVSPLAQEKDPGNRWLARFPRQRLEAEAIRDVAMSVSGLLKEQIGGSSVFPYQPPGLWEQVAFEGTRTYEQNRSQGADNYRRGLYVYWRRSIPYASFVTFDAPSRETCTIRRPRTNTPLQALVLMDDPVYLEAARAFGYRIMQNGGSTPMDRMRYAFRVCLGRNPTSAEFDRMAQAFQTELQHFLEHRADANQLVHVGDTPPPVNVDVIELAAWTMIGQVLLNLDETITKG